MGLRSWRRRVDAPTGDDEPIIGEEHAWWAERDGLQRVFVASTGQDDGADDRPLSEFWSPESLFTYDQRTSDEPDESEDLADPYGILGLAEGAGWDDVTVAHRKLAKRYHPDLMLHAADAERVEAEERMRLVNRAYTQIQRQRRAAVS